MRRVRFKSANERSKGEEEEGKGRGRERKRKRKGKKEEGKGEREIGSRVRFPAGALAIFSVSTKASLPISLSPFPSSFFPFRFLFLSLPLPFPSSSSPFDLSFALQIEFVIRRMGLFFFGIMSDLISQIRVKRVCWIHTTERSCRVSRPTRLTPVCEVIWYRLVQVRQKFKKKNEFQVAGSQSPFSIFFFFFFFLTDDDAVHQNVSQPLLIRSKSLPPVSLLQTQFFSSS